MKTFPIVVLLAGVGLVAGCASVFERRIAQHRGTWDALPAAEQARLRGGVVKPGDSETMVLLAKGPPDRLRVAAAPDGKPVQEWIYWLPRGNYQGPPLGALLDEIVSSGDDSAVIELDEAWSRYHWLVCLRDGQVVEVSLKPSPRLGP